MKAWEAVWEAEKELTCGEDVKKEEDLKPGPSNTKRPAEEAAKPVDKEKEEAKKRKRIERLFVDR